MIEVESIIGVDCACQENRVGLARAEKDGKVWDLREVTMGSRQRPAADIIQEWLEERPGKAILALDAPLGWPAPLRSMLMGHRAGEGVRGEPNMVFRRESDRFVASLLGKTPLDVGADRIARTAHWALSLLEARRRLLPAIVDRLQVGSDSRQLVEWPDAFDAAVCVLGALGFLKGRAVAPADRELAREERWIWVAQPD